MDHQDIISIFRSAGWSCGFETGFRAFHALTGEFGRVLCVEIPGGGPQRGSGISFWVHAGGGLVLLSTWYNALYLIPDDSDVKGLACDLLSGRYLPRNRTPSTLPAVVVSQYALGICTTLELIPQTEGSCSRRRLPLTRDTFLSRLGKCPVSIIASEPDSVRFSFRGMLGFARFGSNAGDRTSVLLSAGSNHTTDHVALYRLLSDSLACELYDPVWECTMVLDDPYYAGESAMSRPEHPRNAFSQAGRMDVQDQ